MPSGLLSRFGTLAPTPRLNDPSSVGANPSEFPLFLGGKATSPTRVNQVFFFSFGRSLPPPSLRMRFQRQRKSIVTYDPGMYLTLAGCQPARVIPAIEARIQFNRLHNRIPVLQRKREFQFTSNKTLFIKLDFPRNSERTKGVPGNLEPREAKIYKRNELQPWRETKEKEVNEGPSPHLLRTHVASGFALSPQRKLDVFFIYLRTQVSKQPANNPYHSS